MRDIEKTIGKEFVEGEIPSAREICKKQLYKVMDQILKTDVNEEEIAPFMPDINRYFEYIDKDDIIKKIVSLEFGKFLAYYADAPEIEKPSTKSEKTKNERGKTERRRDHKPEAGYKRLFINLGKVDGFYPGEIMQFINRHIEGRQEVGNIDLMSKFSYIEVPERDARKVMNAIDGTRYKGREVRCNDADRGATPQRKGKKGSDNGGKQRPDNGFERFEKKSKRRGEQTSDRNDNAGKRRNGSRDFAENGKKDDWRQFFRQADIKLKGEEPDFSEEGWARRRPKKK